MAYSYNVDYWTGESSVEISADMIKLRYADYPKDYFLGVLPASQYGSVAVLPSLTAAYSPSSIVAAGPGSQANLVNPASGSSSVSTTSPNNETESRNLRLLILIYPPFQSVQRSIYSAGRR